MQISGCVSVGFGLGYQFRFVEGFRGLAFNFAVGVCEHSPLSPDT